MTQPIRILIADDHLIIREGLRMILEMRSDFELVGEATDGESAIRLASELQPDVVLMDLRMPGLDGLTAIEQIHAKFPNIAVVILTTYNEDDLMVRGLRAGARGYLLKDTDRETLLSTLRAAAGGVMLLQPEVMSRVLIATGLQSNPHRSGERISLSQRETQVLQAVASGARNKEIAVQLGISERTVKAHLDSVFNKLGVDSRTAAVAEAMKLGILSARPDADSSPPTPHRHDPL